MSINDVPALQEVAKITLESIGVGETDYPTKVDDFMAKIEAMSVTHNANSLTMIERMSAITAAINEFLETETAASSNVDSLLGRLSAVENSASSNATKSASNATSITSLASTVSNNAATDASARTAITGNVTTNASAITATNTAYKAAISALVGGAAASETLKTLRTSITSNENAIDAMPSTMLRVFKASDSYKAGDRVLASDDFIYRATDAGNVDGDVDYSIDPRTLGGICDSWERIQNQNYYNTIVDSGNFTDSMWGDEFIDPIDMVVYNGTTKEKGSYFSHNNTNENSMYDLKVKASTLLRFGGAFGSIQYGPSVHTMLLTMGAGQGSGVVTDGVTRYLAMVCRLATQPVNPMASRSSLYSMSSHSGSYWIKVNDASGSVLVYGGRNLLIDGKSQEEQFVVIDDDEWHHVAATDDRYYGYPASLLPQLRATNGCVMEMAMPSMVRGDYLIPPNLHPIGYFVPH